MDSRWRAWFPRNHQLVLAFMVAVVLLLRLHHLWLTNINWDEFHFLSKVYEFERGQLTSAFQTFHVHLFGWLLHVPGIEIERVLAARSAMYLLNLGSCLCIFLVGRHLLGRTGAWFAVLAAITLSYVMRHGESFRADPLLLFLFMVCTTLLLLCASSRVAVAAAASALALAAVISMKAVFYLPAVLAIFLAKRMRLRHLSIFAGVGIAAYASLYALHSTTVASHSITATVSHVAGVGQRMLAVPRLDYLQTSLAADWVYWLLLGAGVTLALHQAMRTPGEPRRHAILLLGLALPLSSLLFYRNAFPYFYVAVAPAAALLCGLVASRLETWLSHRPAHAAAIIVALAIPLTANALSYHFLNRHDAIAPQRQVLEAVHAMFPEPVPYIDRSGMVSSFPKSGLFMSTFVMSAYRDRGMPVMEDIVRDDQPVFLLGNVAGLDLALPWEHELAGPYRLLQADFEYLRANYVHHWGPIWVAGSSFHLEPGLELDFELAVTGRYTVEADGRVVVNGRERRNGDVVYLESGGHTILSPGTAKSVTLRYGDDLHVPADAPLEAPLFRGLR